MTLTFLDIYNECAGQPWSMYDNEMESSEDFETAMKISINKAISYVWNLYPWIFRKYTQKIKTKVNRDNYIIPDGIIATTIVSNSKKFCVRLDGSFLDYVQDYTILDEQEGEPSSFYVDGENIYFYPTPDDVYTISVDYYLSPFGLNENGDYLYELSDDKDYINIPEKYETYFKNVVISKAMLYAITDQNDENDSGYREQYNDALNTMLKNCYDKTKEKRIII